MSTCSCAVHVTIFRPVSNLRSSRSCSSHYTTLTVGYVVFFNILNLLLVSLILSCSSLQCLHSWLVRRYCWRKQLQGNSLMEERWREEEVGEWEEGKKRRESRKEEKGERRKGTGGGEGDVKGKGRKEIDMDRKGEERFNIKLSRQVIVISQLR